MAYSEVGSGSQRATGRHANADSGTLAFPGSVTSGNLLVVSGANWKSGGSSVTVAVSDTRSTSYTVLETYDGEMTLFIAYGVASSSGACTVTVDPAGTANYFSYSIDEFTGQDATPLDVDGGSSNGTSTTPADSVTTATANDLIIGVMTQSTASSISLTPGGSYTEIGEEEDNGTYQGHNAVFRIVTTAQAYSVDWTMGSSQYWVAKTAAFKEATASYAPLPVKVWSMLNG